MKMTPQQTNDKIGQILLENNPASILRIDNTAGYVMDCMHKGTTPSEQFFNPYTVVECGVTPVDVNYMLQFVYPLTIEVMKRSDLLGFVDISGELERGEFIKQFNDKPMFFGDGFLMMDPGALLGFSHLGEITNPWPMYLKGKKVLVISSHYNSILHQWKNIDKIWRNKRDLIAPFDLVDVIRSPFHPLIDDRQYSDCKSWADTVKYMIKLIDSYDYDVLLTGCTTSSPFFAEHAANRGKIGIQTGATIQLFFGILGGRWTKAPHYNSWHKMFNEHWIYPLKEDEAQKRNQIGFLETSQAYWS